MKKIVLILCVILAIGCSKKATLEVFNNTENNLYFEIDNDHYHLLENESKEISFKTSKKFYEFEARVKKDLTLWGDTFQIGYIGEYPKNYGPVTTTLDLKSDEHRKVYTSPNRALLQIVNASGSSINKVLVKRFDSFEDPSASIEDTYEDFILSNNNSDFYTIVPKEAPEEINSNGVSPDRVHSLTVWFEDGTRFNHPENKHIEILNGETFTWIIDAMK